MTVASIVSLLVHRVGIASKLSGAEAERSTAIELAHLPKRSFVVHDVFFPASTSFG